MPGDVTPWKPTDWERHIQQVLKLRYALPVGSYQHVPADIKGDCGIEGFASDGTAYQCYACQDWTDFAVLLKHQKDKMTLDIGKLVKREAELLTILGDIRIGIWNFVLPFFNNKDILKHARKKETEVRSRSPKHTTPDFRIAVITGDDFQKEKQSLAKQDLYKFDVETLPATVMTAAKWMDQNKGLTLVSNITRKTDIIGKDKSTATKDKFLNQMVKNYTIGTGVLNRLEQEMPEVFEAVMKKKTDREGELETASATTTLVPGQFFDATLAQYKEELRFVSGISPRAADVLAREAVSDWLMRCPLEFE
jgi:hypothetical protein